MCDAKFDGAKNNPYPQVILTVTEIQQSSSYGIVNDVDYEVSRVAYYDILPPAQSNRFKTRVSLLGMGCFGDFVI